MPRPEALRRTRNRARASLRARNSLSTWSVVRPDGGDTDEETGDWTPRQTPVWTGPAQFHDGSRPHVRTRTDTALSIAEPTLCVTADVPRLKIGDVVSPVKVDDDSLMGRSWRIVGEPGSSYAVHRHYPLQEVTNER